jgi:hypothetical protein
LIGPLPAEWFTSLVHTDNPFLLNSARSFGIHGVHRSNERLLDNTQNWVDSPAAGYAGKGIAIGHWKSNQQEMNSETMGEFGNGSAKLWINPIGHHHRIAHCTKHEVGRMKLEVNARGVETGTLRFSATKNAATGCMREFEGAPPIEERLFDATAPSSLALVHKRSTLG